MTGLSTIYTNLDVFLLILVRITSYVLISPVFGRKGVPNTSKVGFSVFLSYIVFFNFDTIITLGDINTVEYILIVGKEILIGLSIGFVSMIFFTIFYTAGQIADFQMGLSLGGMYDQEMQTKVPLVGNLFYVFAFLTFLNLDGMEMLSKILITMYNDVPILGNKFDETFYNVLLNGFYTAYMYAVKMVIPMILLMVITQFLLGVIIKFVPQMNVFIIGIPIKIVLSLMILILMITPLYNLFGDIFKDMFDLSQLIGTKF